MVAMLSRRETLTERIVEHCVREVSLPGMVVVDLARLILRQLLLLQQDTRCQRPSLLRQSAARTTTSRQEQPSKSTVEAQTLNCALAIVSQQAGRSPESPRYRPVLQEGILQGMDDLIYSIQAQMIAAHLQAGRSFVFAPDAGFGYGVPLTSFHAEHALSGASRKWCYNLVQ